MQEIEIVEGVAHLFFINKREIKWLYNADPDQHELFAFI